MLKLATIICSAALVAGCSEKTPPAPTRAASTPAPATLTAEGVGAIRFGMALPDAEAVQKETATGTRSSECTYVQFASIPNVNFMVEKGVITRADLKPGASNITGINAGDDPAQLIAKYPAAQVTAHKYVDKAHNTRIAGPGQSALIFEDDGKVVTRIRGGLEPAVSYNEGCS